MPDVTPNLGLKKPLGNEVVSRAAYNENLDILDQNAAKASDLDAHLAETAPHGAVATPTANKLVLRDAKGQVIGFTPMAEVYNSVLQSIPNDINTVLSFDSENVDNDSIHDNVTNNSRLTCKSAGVYNISGTVGFGNNSTGYRRLFITLNSYVIADITTPAVSAGSTTLTISTFKELAANDYVELNVRQNSGSSLTLESAKFRMVKVGN